MKQIVQEDAPKRIKYIQFGVLSPQEIVSISELEVTHRDLYLFDGNGTTRRPAPNGTLDPRFGTSDKNGVCATCNQKMADCVGHYGYIRLELPVFHVGYFRNIINILQNICKTCSRILLVEEDRRTYLKRFRQPRLENLKRVAYVRAVTALCKKSVFCPHCGAVNGVVKKVGTLKVTHEKFRAKRVEGEKVEWRKTFDEAKKENRDVRVHLEKAQDDLNPLRVLELFKKVPATDCEILGLDPLIGRPEHFIFQYISVPPVCIRPSVSQDSATNEDDLTVKLSEIVFTNQLIRTGLMKGTTTQNLMEQWDFLQLAVAQYINADTPGLQAAVGGTSKPIRGLCQRLKGKQGRFRGNLSGKRVDFSGRTVISPDPNLRIDEVAVPDRIAKILTYPERVTPYNVEQLRKAVINGPDVHPGANFWQQGTGSTSAGQGLQSSGVKRFLKFGKRDELAKQLKVGDIVERHLRDGDIVLFNRQPSLHKLSILSHRVKVRPWRTLRMNECVCNPYNADFDGDEMNIHVPQTEESRTEALQLMNIKHNLVTPRNGQPIIAAIQDFITASYLLSRKDNFYDRKQFVQIASYLQDANVQIDLPPPVILKPQRLWTGKQIFGLLMRPNKQSKVLVNLEAKNKIHEKAAAGFIADMSPNDGYLVIQNSEVMCGVMDKPTVGDGKKNSVFGVIMRDYGPDEAAKAMNRIAKLAARWLATKGFSIGISDVTPGDSLRKQKDALVDTAYSESNNYIALARRGKLENQPGCDQDQTLESVISGTLSKVRDKAGEICMTELSRHNAPLIMATCGSKGSNINVCQMVACVGQQIISGSRVPNGFQDRSLPHFMKNSKDPPSKGFVRNSFFTGLRATEFLFHAISGREGLVDTAVKTAETGYMQRRLMKALEDLSTRYDRSVRNSTGGVVQFTYGDDGLDPAALEAENQPVEFLRTWQHTRATISHLDGRGLLPYEIVAITDNELSSSRFKDECTDSFIKDVREYIRNSIAIPAAKYREAYGMFDALEAGEEWDEHTDLSGFATPEQKAIVSNKTQVTEKQLRGFLNHCWVKYVKAKIEPGTAVGAVGAQSIGEPGTQMTLKTFHFAGVASMNVTLGVPRIKEIINAAKVINTPIITAALVSENELSARIVKGRIEKTYLGDIASVMAPTWSGRTVFIRVDIDMDAVEKLKLEVTLDSIRYSIINAPKLKIPNQSVKKLGQTRLMVEVIQSDHDPSDKEGPTHTKELMRLLRVLPTVMVKGISTATRAVIAEEKGVKQLLVEGYGLREVMATEGIIGEKTTTNHVIETQKVLGIEAARAGIIKEIAHTMGSHGLHVDPRHVMLLGDIMCFKGEVLGITRFGVAKMRDSVLMLASFEKTTDHLFEAAVYSKSDAITGVSECIIMGMPSNNCGTAMPVLVSDPVKLRPVRPLLFEGVSF